MSRSSSKGEYTAAPTSEAESDILTSQEETKVDTTTTVAEEDEVAIDFAAENTTNAGTIYNNVATLMRNIIR